MLNPLRSCMSTGQTIGAVVFRFGLRALFAATVGASHTRVIPSSEISNLFRLRL